MIEINIQYKLAVRNGFVEIPGEPHHSTSLTPEDVLVLFPTAVRKRQVHTALMITDQEWIELPAFDKAVGPAEDYYTILRNNA